MLPPRIFFKPSMLKPQSPIDEDVLKKRMREQLRFWLTAAPLTLKRSGMFPMRGRPISLLILIAIRRIRTLSLKFTRWTETG